MSGIVRLGMVTLDMKELDFFVIKEDYSRFLLNDGTTMKVKIVIRKIFSSPLNTPEGYPTDLAFDGFNLAVALVPRNIKREPTEPFDPLNDKGDEIQFTEQRINEQEYMTDDNLRISIRPILTKVFKYKKYNAFGEPVYTVSLQQITNMDKVQSTSPQA